MAKKHLPWSNPPGERPALSFMRREKL